MPGCAIANCKNNNSRTKNKEVKYFSFPKTDEFKEKWIHACRRSNKINFKNACICSVHFETSCFEIPLRQQLLKYTPKNSRNLKFDAVPTLNLPIPSTQSENNTFCGISEVDSPSELLTPINMEHDIGHQSVNSSTSCQRAIALFKKAFKKSDLKLFDIKMDKCRMKEKFYEHINRRPQKANSSQMSSTKYFKLMDEVKAAKSGINKENRHYWLLKHYDVITINMEEKLIVPLVNGQVLYYVVLEELFDILYETHASISHGGRDRMKNVLQQQYKNITIQDIQTFLNLCERCVQKRMCEKKGLVSKPMIFLDFNSRCQVDLLDFQSRADGEYKFIMIYQDYLTKFVILRALKSEQAVEVAEQLLNIFLLFGAPSILQSDNGREFVNNIIEDLKKMWPELKIILGKTEHNQSQGSVERTSQDIENILNTWMKQNQCDNWSKGLGFVQFIKNKALHGGNRRSPFQAMFGQPAKMELSTSSLPPDIIQDVNTEEDLEKVLQETVMQQDTFKKIKLEVDNIQATDMTENVLFEQVWVEDNLLKDEVSDDVNTIESDKENAVLALDKFCRICEATMTSLSNTDVCELCSLQMKIKNSRKEAKEHLEIKAKRMKIISDTSHSQAEITMNVPDVNRDGGDPRSVWTCH